MFQSLASSSRWRALALGTLVVFQATGCAASRQMAPSAALEARMMEAEAPAPLTENHFLRDTSGGVTEEGLREILKAPTYLEAGARVGVVAVGTAYGPDGQVPVVGVPAALSEALEATGEFELACEVSTDFPSSHGLAGLRELAARYRTDYLLLYRQRFVERARPNELAWGYVTLVGALVLPGNTMEGVSVLEATLLDVKSGTLLFTVFERARAEEAYAPPRHGYTAQRMQERLLEQAAPRLVDQVRLRLKRLVAARPARAREAEVISSVGLSPEVEPVPVDTALR